MLKFDITGDFTDRDLKRVKGVAGKKGARNLVKKLDRYTDRTAQKFATKSAGRAPVLTGALRNSLQQSKRKKEPMHYEVGSDRDYATYQEFTHVRFHSFVRKTLWEIRNPYVSGVRNIIRTHGGF